MLFKVVSHLFLVAVHLCSGHSQLSASVEPHPLHPVLSHKLLSLYPHIAPPLSLLACQFQPQHLSLYISKASQFLAFLFFLFLKFTLMCCILYNDRLLLSNFKYLHWSLTNFSTHYISIFCTH